MRLLQVVCLAIAAITLTPVSKILAADPPAKPAVSDAVVIPELSKPVTVQFLATPLGKALDTLAGYAAVPFVVDKSKLEMDAPVTLDIKNIPLQTVLVQMRKLGLLDFDFREGVVFVTSKNEMFRQRMVSRVYDVRALVTQVPDFNDSPQVVLPSVSYSSGGGGGSLFSSAVAPPADVAGETVEQIARLIKETVDTENWTEVRHGAGGGPATIIKRGHLLVVTTVPEVQKEIAELIANMYKAYGKTLSVEGRYLLIKTAALDKLIKDKGNGTLVLDAKAAEELLTAAAKGEGGLQIAGAARTVCFNGQRVWLTAGSEASYMANLTPVVAEGTDGLSPTISSIVQGTTLDVLPTSGWNDEWISLVVRTYATSHAELRELNTTLLGAITSSATLQGTVNIPASQSDKTSTSANMSGTITPPRFADSTRSKLQLPAIEGFRTKTMVKVPNGGAVLISGSSSDQRKPIAEGREMVLLLRATANK